MYTFKQPGRLVSRVVLVPAGTQTFKRDAVALELVASPSDRRSSREAQPTGVLLECTLVEADARAPTGRRHAASSLVVARERAELLVEPPDLSGRSGPRTDPSVDVVGARSGGRELKRTEEIRDRQLDDRLRDPQPVRDLSRSEPLEHQRQHGLLARCQVTKLLSLSGKTLDIDHHADKVATAGRSVHGPSAPGPRPGSTFRSQHVNGDHGGPPVSGRAINACAASIADLSLLQFTRSVVCRDMPTPASDMTAAAELRDWVCDRTRARRRARVVAAAFGRAELTARARSDIETALLAVGVDATPSLATCAREDWLDLVARQPPTAPIAPDLSTALPSQLAAWHAFNWTGGDGTRRQRPCACR
jgi:hypothetical protein